MITLKHFVYYTHTHTQSDDPFVAVIHVFEIAPLSSVDTIKHGFSVTDIQLMTTNKEQEKRHLALIDSSMNIFIVLVGGPKDSSKIYKLGNYNYYYYKYTHLQYSRRVTIYILYNMNILSLITKYIKYINSIYNQ